QRRPALAQRHARHAAERQPGAIAPQRGVGAVDVVAAEPWSRCEIEMAAARATPDWPIGRIGRAANGAAVGRGVRHARFVLIPMPHAALTAAAERGITILGPDPGARPGIMIHLPEIRYLGLTSDD